MRDLDKVTRLAKENSRLELQRLADDARKRHVRSKNMELLSARLKVFVADLRSKIGIYLSTSGNETRVSISSMHPFLRKPFRIVAIYANDSTPSYNVTVLLPEHSDYKQEDHLALDDVMDVLALHAAEFLNQRGSFSYELPSWCFAPGAIVGWFLFILGWIILAAIFGAF
jgi:hypothetical protein